jgi:hypothetical protein
MAYACIKRLHGDSGKSNQLVSFRPTVKSGVLQDIASSLALVAAWTVVVIGASNIMDALERELAQRAKRPPESFFSGAARWFRGWAQRQLETAPVLYCLHCHQRFPMLDVGIWCHSGRHFFCRRCFSVSMRLLGLTSPQSQK